MILGNGPSIVDNWDSILELSDSCDISGTSAISMSRLSLAYYLTEPGFFLLDDLSTRFTSNMEFTRVVLYYMLVHEWCYAAGDSDKCKVIIPNPQIPPNQYGYLRYVTHENIIVPPFYSVTETSDKRIASDLKTYFSVEKQFRPLLNFRSSIVRQLVLGFLLGYKTISVFGLDPSVNSYWWSLDESLNRKVFSDESYERVSQVLEHYSRADSLCNVNYANCFDVESVRIFDFNSSIFAVLHLLLRESPDVQVNFYCSDPAIAERSSCFLMDRFSNYSLIT